MTQPAKPGVSVHYVIDADLFEAFRAAVPLNDRTHWIERVIAKALKRQPPAKRVRGRPRKAEK